MFVANCLKRANEEEQKEEIRNKGKKEKYMKESKDVCE